MFDVPTLIVGAGTEADSALADTLASLRWACDQPLATLTVDTTGRAEVANDGMTHTLRIPSQLPVTAPAGFHCGYGLQWALDNHVVFKQALVVDNTCLAVGRPLDTWALTHLVKEGVGILGVQDRRNAEEAFRRAIPLFFEWELPHQRWEQPPMVLDESAYFLSAPAVSRLYQAKLLAPTGCERWVTHAGAYYAWCVQMLGLHAVAWGFMDKPMPPLFLSYRGYPLQPAPHILLPQFMLYSSVRDVASYPEEQLRAIYKRLRGEPATVYPAFAPTVSAPPA